MDGISPYDVLQVYDYLAAEPAQVELFQRLVAPQGALAALSAASFLLYYPSAQSGGSAPICVERFVYDIAPVLLQQFSRVTEARRVTLHGRTRGKVDWSATYKARNSADSNPTLFVCQQSWRRFDRPENQLVKYLFKLIGDCLQRIPRSLWSWQAWGKSVNRKQPPELGSDGFPLPPGPDLGHVENLSDRFASLAHRLRLYSTYSALQDVALPYSIETRHILAARTSKNELYADAADLYEQYLTLVGRPLWASWRQALGGTLPLPASLGGVLASVLQSRWHPLTPIS
jgi:hypothetical protein